MYFPVREKLSIDQPNKITFSVYAAAALMNLMRRQRDAVGLKIFSDKIQLSTAAKSNSVHFKYLYSELEKMLEPIPVELQRDTLATAALHEIADNIHQRSLVVIFSDMFENAKDGSGLFSALQHLRHNKHEVVLFHVVDKKQEIDFDFDNRPYKFIDLESGKQVKVNPLEVKAEYNKAIQSFTSELKVKCGQYRVDFVEADINSGFEQIMLPYLLKREKLY
jgi:uncharacterized protein (DUF58 family)